MIKKSLFILNPNLSSFPMQLIIKKLLIIITVIITIESNLLKVFASNHENFDDYGLISIMYHRFDESKYPSTNIQLDVFKEQLKIIENLGIEFIHPKNFQKSLIQNKKKIEKFYLRSMMAFCLFMKTAWPILKEKNIPFILFVNTREVGAYNYMNWNQILNYIMMKMLK